MSVAAEKLSRIMICQWFLGYHIFGTSDANSIPRMVYEQSRETNSSSAMWSISPSREANVHVPSDIGCVISKSLLMSICGIVCSFPTSCKPPNCIYNCWSIPANYLTVISLSSYLIQELCVMSISLPLTILNPCSCTILSKLRAGIVAWHSWILPTAIHLHLHQLRVPTSQRHRRTAPERMTRYTPLHPTKNLTLLFDDFSHSLWGKPCSCRFAPLQYPAEQCPRVILAATLYSSMTCKVSFPTNKTLPSPIWSVLLCPMVSVFSLRYPTLTGATAKS